MSPTTIVRPLQIASMPGLELSSNDFGIAEFADDAGLADNNDGAIGYAEQLVSLGPTSTGPTSTDLWEFDASTSLLLGIAMAVVVVPAAFALRRIYASLKIDGEKVSGFMPARGFSEAVIDAGKRGLRIFYGFDEIKRAWKAAPEDGRDKFSQENRGSEGEVFTITRGPFRDWGLFSTYGVSYVFSDGELKFVDAYRQGGILGGLLYRFTPYRELPPATPPEGKQAVTQIAEIGDEAVALKVHELAQGAGEEIKIYPTVDDFRLALGGSVSVTTKSSPRLDVNQKGLKGENLVRTSYWRGTGQPTDGETIALAESTWAWIFFTSLERPPDELEKIYGMAYSTGIIEVAYDLKGGRVSRLEPGKMYHVYQVRYNYAKDGRLLRTAILKKLVELDPKWGTERRSIESEVLFDYRPGDARQVRDSPSASDRAELALSGPDRDVSAAVREIRTWLEIAYKRVKSGELMNASGYFLRIADHAKHNGLKVIEAVARVAAGDMSVMRDHPCNFVDAAAAYSAALSVLEGEEFRDAAKTVAALKGEAILVENTQIVRAIWDEMRPEGWLFRDPLAKLEGGVASESLEDAVLSPEILRAESAAGRVETLTTRREFLDAFRAAERAREAVEKVEKR